MQPHLLLQREVIKRWAKRIAEEKEEGTVLLSAADPVVTKWEKKISEALPEVKIKNACVRHTCPKRCAQCSSIAHELAECKGKSLFLNYKSSKMLFVKVKPIRCVRTKHLQVSRSVIDLFTANDKVNIVEANRKKVLLPKKLFAFFHMIDKDYQNPPLLVSMVKYLEFEKKFRNSTEKELDLIIHALRVSFFYDPILVENSRINVYRQNNIG